MDISSKEIEIMLHLQDTDLLLLQLKKKLADLPQRADIIKTRTKRKSVLKKKARIVDMLDDIELELSDIEEEDKSLADKAKESQEEINDVKGDFRAVEARTKELAGISKRRETLGEKLNDLNARYSKIDAMKKQIDDALSALDDSEDLAIQSFKEEGGNLQRQINETQIRRNQLADQLTDATKDLYEKSAKAGSGIAIGKFVDGCCSVCRTKADAVHAVRIKKEKPLSVCPACKRLIVVE